MIVIIDTEGGYIKNTRLKQLSAKRVKQYCRVRLLKETEVKTFQALRSNTTLLTDTDS